MRNAIPDATAKLGANTPSGPNVGKADLSITCTYAILAEMSDTVNKKAIACVKRRKYCLSYLYENCSRQAFHFSLDSVSLISINLRASCLRASSIDWRR